MQKQTIMHLLIAGVLLLLCNCASDSGSLNSNPVQMGRLQIQITDAPGDFEAVRVSFSQVSAKVDSEWITLADSARTIDLLQYTNGNALLLAEGEVPAGRYNQIRLKIDSAEVVVDGQIWPAMVPGGATSGLKLNSHFTVNPAETFGLTIDFDVSRSVVATGPPQNPTGYKIKPVLRAVSTMFSGSISAIVTNPEALPVAYALQGADTVSSTVVDVVGGGFVLAFLPAGYYEVSVSDTLLRSFFTDSILVVAGAPTELAGITLQ